MLQKGVWHWKECCKFLNCCWQIDFWLFKLNVRPEHCFEFDMTALLEFQLLLNGLEIRVFTVDVTMYQPWNWRWPDSRDWSGRRLGRVLCRKFHWLLVYFSVESPNSQNSLRKCRSNDGARPVIKSAILTHTFRTGIIPKS